MRRPAPTSVPRRRPFLVAVALLGLVSASCGQLEQLSTQQALDRLNVATTEVFDARGNVITDLHGEIDRDIVPFAQIPKHVRDAVVAIEDERFWVHQGLDLRSIARAAVTNAGSGAGGQVQGGSTISQQLAKNLYFPRPARNVTRKLAEARVTLELERQYSKSEILHMYLNTIYLGRGLYGIETAAHSYFGKSTAQLTLAEAAFLAGLIHEPARYEWSPTDPPERMIARQRAARDRRNVVLQKMERLRWISRARELRAEAEPLVVKPLGERLWNHPYFVDYVLKQLGVLRNSASDVLDPRYDFLGQSFKERSARVYRGGLRIYTTLDPTAQTAAEHAVATILPKDLDRLSTALVAIEPSTGYVRALVGGRNYYPSCPKRAADTPDCLLAKLNLALGAYGGGSGRQPGSSFKPFVLTAALERGVTLSQSYPSDPFSYTYKGGVWQVNNYDGTGSGDMDLVSGTVHSVNAVFAHLEIDGVGDGDGLAGAERVASVARRLGIGLPTRDQLKATCGAEYFHPSCYPADDTPAIALGAKEVSPIDMATAYATLANDGVRVTPTAVVRITDGSGRNLYQARPEQEQVVPSGVARAVTSVLKEVIQHGTATAANIDRPAAAKTGTSQAWRDAWLAGYVPQLAAVVWVGNPIPKRYTGVESMTPANGYPFDVVGGTFPAMIWHSFMTDAVKDVPVQDFPSPPSLVFRPPLGPSPTPASPFDLGGSAVPNVIGQLHSAAVHHLERAGYAAAETEQCSSDPTTHTHQVWAQSPGAGQSAAAGSTVTIWYQPIGCGR